MTHLAQAAETGFVRSPSTGNRSSTREATGIASWTAEEPFARPSQKIEWIPPALRLPDGFHENGYTVPAKERLQMPCEAPMQPLNTDSSLLNLDASPSNGPSPMHWQQPMHSSNPLSLAGILRTHRENLHIHKQHLTQMCNELDKALLGNGPPGIVPYSGFKIPILSGESPMRNGTPQRLKPVLGSVRSASSDALPQNIASQEELPQALQPMCPPSPLGERDKDSGAGGSESYATGGVGSSPAGGFSAMVGDLPYSKQANKKQLIVRLQARLGIRNANSSVTAMRLHKTLHHLGSQLYTLEDISQMLSAMASSSRDLPATVLEEEEGGDQGFSIIKGTSKDREVGGAHTTLRSASNVSCHIVSFKLFVSVFLLEDARLNQQFTSQTAKMIHTCREILVSGDANRLVAELTQVHVDDLAQPEVSNNWYEWMEPLSSLVILVNGVMIGWQASQTEDDLGSEMIILDASFTLFFFLEMCLKIFAKGWRWYFQGGDRWWNIFDVCIIFGGVVDTIVALTWTATKGTKMFSMIRVIRLARLARLFRVLKLKQTRELTLMVKGVVVGLRTLFWAIMLLLFTIYILGVFATVTLGDNVPPLLDEDLFRNVPLAMLTVFRCLMSDCMDRNGRPLVHMYSELFGLPFVLGYVAAMIFVIFGVFNLIFAIYIETTLAAAKSTKQMDRKESVRVARTTRELLKKFALAHRLYHEESPEFLDALADGDANKLRSTMRDGEHKVHDIDESQVVISKDLFLVAIQDPDVQKLLDALDISPDRASLFDVLDADGSGDVEATELVQGLLRVRGEARKSDVVANLLGIRACQQMIRKVEASHEQLASEVRKVMTSRAIQGAESIETANDLPEQSERLMMTQSDISPLGTGATAKQTTHIWGGRNSFRS